MSVLFSGSGVRGSLVTLLVPDVETGWTDDCAIGSSDDDCDLFNIGVCVGYRYFDDDRCDPRCKSYDGQMHWAE